MKSAVIFAMLALVATDASAIDRINANSLTCDAIKAKVSSEYQAIIHYSRANNGLYEPVVADDADCEAAQRAVGFGIQSADSDRRGA